MPLPAGMPRGLTPAVRSVSLHLSTPQRGAPEHTLTHRAYLTRAPRDEAKGEGSADRAQVTRGS